MNPSSELRPSDGARIVLSVVAPAHNEEGNIVELVRQVGAAGQRAAEVAGGVFEFVIVDDGSTDRTRALIQEQMSSRPWLRCVAMSRTPPGKGNGQSAAFHAGFRATRGGLVAVLDADLQNDPAELVQMIELMRRENADLVQGDRSHARKDNLVRRIGSKVGRFFRRAILGDDVRDTGCSLRVMTREVALRLPLEFRGMHRFIPVSAARMGYKVVQMPVVHRPRTAGTTKYGLGITQRALPGLIDCFAVLWMSTRRRSVESIEVRETSPAASSQHSTPPAPRPHSGQAQPAGAAT